MIPVIFQDCFGWLHDAHGSRGVVLVPPYGYEALCTHRGWRMLAETLAEAGFPTLRFDLPGTGDSAGAEEDPERLECWLDAIDAAVSCLRARTGVQRVALCGLRFGATLAALAARAPDVDALAMLAPVVSGRTWLRELRALDRVAGTPGGSIDGVTSAGFTLHRAAVEEISALDLRGLEEAPTRHVLIVQPEGRDEALAGRLRGLGALVTTAKFEDCDTFLSDALLSRPPQAAFASVARFLAKLPPAPRVGPISAAGQHHMAVAGGTETPLRLGARGELFGMLTEPEAQAGGPAVLIPNTGANHHVGNARFAVLLARRLAAQGIATLRMDTYGLGDSELEPEGPGAVLYTAGSCNDVRMGLDALQAQGYDSVVVVGLCSGAWLALQTAVADARVRGLAAINLQRFIWRKGTSLQVALKRHKRSAHTYFSALREAESWKAALRGEVDLLGICRTLGLRFGERVAARLVGAAGLGPLQRVRGWMRTLAQRDVRVMLVFSEDDPGIDELETYFGAGGDWLRRLPNVALRTVPEADHSLHAGDARANVMRWVENFVTSGSLPAEPTARAKEGQEALPPGPPLRTVVLRT